MASLYSLLAEHDVTALYLISTHLLVQSWVYLWKGNSDGAHQRGT